MTSDVLNIWDDQSDIFTPSNEQPDRKIIGDKGAYYIEQAERAEKNCDYDRATACATIALYHLLK